MDNLKGKPWHQLPAEEVAHFLGVNLPIGPSSVSPSIYGMGVTPHSEAARTGATLSVGLVQIAVKSSCANTL